MGSVTKKDLIDRVANKTSQPRTQVRTVLQALLEEISLDIARGERIEFRDFGVFEVKVRKSRVAQNPKTLEPVNVPPKRIVRFKPGRQLRLLLEGEAAGIGNDHAGGGKKGSAKGLIEPKPTADLPHAAS